MTFRCPTCGGSGGHSDDPEMLCPTCLGYAVVVALTSICPACKGGKQFCATCKGKGVLPAPIPFTSDVKSIAVTDLQSAIQHLQTGEPTDVDEYVLGVAAGLLTVGVERTLAFDWISGEIWKGFKSAGVLQITAEGIWYFPDADQPIAAKIVQYPIQ